MTRSDFTSSDSVRSRRPLRHARRVAFGELRLELGGCLSEIVVVYETWGRLNRARDNAVLICHALSGDSHAARHSPSDDPGWWDVVVGPGKSIDTRKYFVICPNVLGGCRGTTGPNSLNPDTGRPYGAHFPTITTADIVEVQKRLVDHLGVRMLLGVIGGSMGGHQVLEWATRHPKRVRGALAVATSPRLTMQALAFDVVGRNAILSDPHFHDGQYYDKESGPDVGLALARMLGHITYLSRQAMQEKFADDLLHPRDVATEFEKKFSVGSYLAYQGDRFVERFDANSYNTLTMAMDRFNLGATPAKLRARLARSRCRWLVLSFTSDWLFPSEQSREIVNALLALGRSVTYCNVESPCGHDAFLLEDNLATYGEMIRAFLARLIGREESVPSRGDDDAYALRPTSIFHRHRVDYDRIVSLIPRGASVLDVGCGPGGLLRRLKRRGHAPLMGVELNERDLVTCVRRGIDAVQADVNHGLGALGDRQFDLVVLSLALQVIRNVPGVLREAARVGRRVVVSFPNFAHEKLLGSLAERGRMPRASRLLPFEWYNSPNIRYLTIADFDAFCRKYGFRIHQRVGLDTGKGREVKGDLNRLADMAIFVVSR
ncbi:MAG: homoserine O-acetyltransferase [Verrucomicrobiae bacterium]|nr:homoserine O-acetyltransferase [Verrucomicrobiae bacterium]